MKPDRIWVHPKYMGNKKEIKNDVAILHLPIELIFNPGIQPIEFDTETLATEMNCMVVGWGRTSGKATVTHFRIKLVLKNNYIRLFTYYIYYNFHFYKLILPSFVYNCYTQHFLTFK